VSPDLEVLLAVTGTLEDLGVPYAKVQGASLDRAYLERWATELGVSVLLARALVDSGLDS
jgi:hypothetical protein